MEDNNLMQEMLDAMDSSSFRAPRRGDVIEGKVVMVSENEVVVNIGYKADGIIPREEISSNDDLDLFEEFKEDQELDVYVLKTDNGDGNVLLSIKRLAMDKDFKELEPVYEAGEVIKVEIKQVVKGGVIAYFKNVRGFIPASHISLRFENDLNKYIGESVEVKIIEYDKRKRRAVFSRKELLKSARAEKKDSFFETVEVGQVVNGTVKRLANFGAFVDIGGFDGLVHVTEITYGRIKSPAEYLKVNDQVKVKVLSVDKETEKISLSVKQTQPNPWDLALEKYEVGSTHPGRVVNTTDFGAFVELEPGVEGLVHISQIAIERIEKPSDVLTENKTYDFEVLEIDTVDKKIKLSRKSLLESDEAEAAVEAVEAEVATEE